MEIMGLTIGQFFSALFSIVMIDLVLAGDNAIVVGMACRNLPKSVQMKGIVLGTVGAVIIRILATLAVVWLLNIQGLRLIGGLLLIWIGYKLLAQDDQHDKIAGKDSLMAAIITIIVADAAMGIDNVLAVAGASHGSYLMVVLGLMISVPIMVFGSTLLIKLMDRFPWIIDLGAAVIAYTASKMIIEEPFTHHILGQPAVKWPLMILIVGGVMFLGKRTKKLRAEKSVLKAAEQNAK